MEISVLESKNCDFHTIHFAKFVYPGIEHVEMYYTSSFSRIEKKTQRKKKLLCCESTIRAH